MLDDSCTNGSGDLACNCDAGYSGDGTVGNCNDIHECDTGADNYSTDALSNNTISSFVCTCNTGYRGDGVECANIDECAE